MTHPMSNLWRGAVAAVLLGLSACGGGEPAPEAGTKVEGLVSSESQLTCTSCGTTRYTDSESGFGWTCSEALRTANGYLDQAMQWQCPAGSCNVVRTNLGCTPVGPSRLDGFDYSITATYSCCQ